MNLELIRKELTSYAGIKSTIGRRRDVEMRYYIASKKAGTRKLRGRYRP